MDKGSKKKEKESTFSMAKKEAPSSPALVTRARRQALFGVKSATPRVSGLAAAVFPHHAQLLSLNARQRRGGVLAGCHHHCSRRRQEKLQDGTEAIEKKENDSGGGGSDNPTTTTRLLLLLFR